MKKIYGFLCLDTETDEYRLIWCENGILATGGPGRLYFDSVYPESQSGANGLALEAGSKGEKSDGMAVWGLHPDIPVGM